MNRTAHKNGITNAFHDAAWGAFLGLGSPLGLLAIRYVIVNHQGFWLWLGKEISGPFGVAYLYTTVGTVLAFSLLGYFWGHQYDNLGRRLGAVERTSDELRQLSVTDSLTGLFARRHLMERLEEEMKRARRHYHPLACLFVDVDNLKPLNDRCGHLFGDHVLVSVGKLMSANVRASDILGRYGGDEFVAILPETNADQAYVVAERIRRAFGSISFRHSNETLGATVSVGVYATSTLPASANLFLQMADTALQKAKAAGKNSTVVNSVRSVPAPTVAGTAVGAEAISVESRAGSEESDRPRGI